MISTRSGRINYQRLPREDEFLLFTGNSYVRADGALVMGRGAAQQVRDYHKGIDQWFGTQITTWDTHHYGVLIHRTRLGVFQVKESFRDEADLALIANSAHVLSVLAYSFPKMEFTCNYPGIGNGRLTIDEVRPVLEAAGLPENVTFWV